jgi:NitT/TauT family transport system substrate-binding protein
MTEEQQARQLADIRALALQKATLSEGLGFPDLRHIERALAALSDVEGHAPAIRPGDVVDLRFWKAAPIALKRSSW